MSTGMFILHSNYTPAGDQPEAIARLLSDIEEGATHQTLKGITGSGKTFTMANVIHRLKRPTLILAPKDAPINLSCSRGKLQFSRHLQRHWTKSDRKIMYGELFRPVLRVKREPHPYP